MVNFIRHSSLIFCLFLLVFFNSSLSFAGTPQEIKITNVRDTVFTVSWITDSSETCQINYGTTVALGSTVYDSRGQTYSDDTHYVTVSGLSPNQLYYFDVISGGVTYNNGGAHYTCTTGQTIGLPNSGTVYGRVFKSDGVTAAQGTIVYITLQDNNASGSAGASAQMSALIDASGYWYTNLGNARTQDLSAYFSYSAAGDNLILFAQGAGDGTTSQTIDTNNDYPAPDMVLSAGAIPKIEVSIFNDAGYTRQDKFFNAGNVVYLQANITNEGTPIEGAEVTADLKINGGAVIEDTINFTEIGDGVYRGSWVSTSHTADVYLVEVNANNPAGSSQNYFHLYSGSGVSAYKIDYDQDGNDDYALENKHLISVYDGTADTDKLLIYLEQKDSGVNYTFKPIADPDSKGRGEPVTNGLNNLLFSEYTFSPFGEGENFSSANLDMTTSITNTSAVNTSFNLSIKMKTEDADYLVFNLFNFDEFIDDINVLFPDITGTIGINMEDDRYHIGNGTDNLVTAASASIWTDFGGLDSLEKYAAIYDNSIINDLENNNVISLINFNHTAYLTFNNVSVWNEPQKEGLRINYDTSLASPADAVTYLLVFTQGDYQNIDKWMPTIYNGEYPAPNFMAEPPSVLGISVSPQNWEIGVVTSEQIVSSGMFTVKNTGSMTETFTLNINGTSSPSGWLAGSLPGTETYVMRGLFGATNDNPAELFYNDDVILMGSPSAATEIKFGDAGLTLNGKNVVSAEQRGLWLRFQSPASSNYLGQQQELTVVVGAQP